MKDYIAKIFVQMPCVGAVLLSMGMVMHFASERDKAMEQTLKDNTAAIRELSSTLIHYVRQ